MTYVVIAILVVALVLVLRQMFKKATPPPAPAKPKEDLSNVSVANARIGDTISVAGAGDEFADLDFTVDRRSRYEAGPSQSFELTGRYKERRVYIEVEDEEELNVTGFFSGKKMTVDDIGLSEEDLAAMDERQNTADFFEYDGKNWLYHFSKELVLFRDGGTIDGSRFYAWEFLEQDGTGVLSVEKWEGEPFVVAMGKKLNPADITVYRGS
jgi:hypothetical protein